MMALQLSVVQPLSRSGTQRLPSGEKQLWLPWVRHCKNSSRPLHKKLCASLQSVEAVPKTSEAVSHVDWNELSIKLDKVSPFSIIQRALQMFGSDIAIAFSGAEDVALIEYAHLTGLPFRVLSLETGRLHEETMKLFDDVEKRYKIHIEFMFPDAAEVEAMVRAKGLFSFYQDGHQECCGIRKVQPLRRALKGLRAWITGQRRDQSPGTRSNIPVVQVDPSFEGLDGGLGSLIKWNPFSNVKSSEVWNFLHTMDVPVNALHVQGFVSIGCQPCTRPVLPGQHEREGRWWWEDSTAKECGLHKGNISSVDSNKNGKSTNGTVIPDIFTGENVTVLMRNDMEGLISGPREKAGLVALYAPWCPFSQAMVEAYNEVANILAVSNVMVGRFRADQDQKTFSQENFQLKSFPTIIFLPKGTDVVVKYLSERRDVQSLLAFVKNFE